jgi:hypothetical protein
MNRARATDGTGASGATAREETGYSWGEVQAEIEVSVLLESRG